MQISAIEPRKKGLSALFLDGEFVVNLDTETLLKAGLRPGQELTDEALHEVLLASEARRANEKALYLLEYRSHSKKELVEKIQRTTSPEAAKAAADRMEELGLVDDIDYARRYASDLLNRKRLSASRTVYELLQKGIDRELAEELVEELAQNPEEKIREIIERKYSRCLGDEKGLRRTVNGLLRLGYQYADIRRALDEFSETDE